MKKKTIDDKIEVIEYKVGEPKIVAPSKVEPLRQEFGNGEVNLLRDKINEIITCLNS